MKKRPSLSPRQLLLSAAIILFCTLTILLICGRRQDEKKFSAISQDLFAEEMLSNTLNMHYTLANPADFGIDSYDPILPVYSADTKENNPSLQETLDALRAVNPRRLSSKNAYTYELLVRLLESSGRVRSFPYYREPLSPSSGIQSQLPVLLAEYAFRTKRDVEDYLALLDQVDSYLGSILTYEKEKAAAGMAMSAASLKQVREQCDTIITKSSLIDETHFLQTTFQERLDELCAAGVITPKEAAKYISQNNRLLRTVVQPAYEALADGIFLMEDEEYIQPRPSGLAARPEGREYYQALLVAETGSYRSIEDIRRLLSESFKEEYAAVCALVKENPTLSSRLSEGSHRTLSCGDAVEMLADLRRRTEKDFPALGDFPEVSVKTVSANLEDYCAPAFYLTAPLDDTDSNVIYINKKDSSSDLDLYTTLAHEGYPGHLYQTVYSNRDFLTQDENIVRQLLWYGGYLEGWAIYTEFYGYDYASQLLREQGRDEDALCAQLEKHNRSILLNLYSTMDIMIHYENASREDIARTLEKAGIKNESAANAVYDYIADAPCNYLKYYLGYLEILELKKAAREQWGDAYSDYRFHGFLLDAGPSDFTALQELLESGISGLLAP